jgi:hypothetical protein
MANNIGASIEPEAVALQAGATGEVIAKVKNLGQTVDQFTLSIDGIDPSWYTLPVSSVALFPNDQDDMRIILHPPKAMEDKPGRYSFRINIVSRENPDEIAAADLSIEIKPLLDLGLEISPEQAVGRRADYQVTVTNPHDSAATVRLEAADDRQRLRYRFNIKTLTVPGRGRAGANLEVRPNWLAFFGGEKTFEFWVATARAEEEARVDFRFCTRCGHEFLPSYDDIPVIGPWYSERLRQRYGGTPIFCPGCSRRIRADALIADAEFVRTSWTNSLPRLSLRWLRRIRFPRIRLPSYARQPIIDTFKATTENEREFIIAWSVKRARKVELNGEDVDAKGDMFVCPAENTTYTLTAINRSRTTSEAIEVHPLRRPQETSSERIGAVLSTREIKVHAGSVPEPAMLQVQNLGDIVDKFSVGIEGIDESWCIRSASSVGLMPEATDQVQLSFQPPKKEGVRAGNYPFVISVRSQAAPEEVTIVAGQLEVLPAPECRLEVRPVHVSGRRKGTFRVNVENTGVSDVVLAPKASEVRKSRFKFWTRRPKETEKARDTAQAQLKATDLDEGCRFQFKTKRPEVTIRAWNTAEIQMIARPKRGFMGEEKRYDITVAAAGAGVNTQPANCQLHHRPFIRSWKTIWRLLKFLIFVAIVVVLIWWVIHLGGGWGQLTSSPGDWWDNLRETIGGWF